MAAAAENVVARAKQERPALLDTLKELVAIESGSSDIEGLDRIRDVIAKRFSALGAKVDIIDPEAPAPGVGIPAKIGKIIRATFTGTGTKKILLLAHMDTVYPRGMLAKQPFKIDGDKAWGLGIADDKHGIALILHTMSILNSIHFKDYGTVTVMVNADEEISSVGSRNIIVRAGAEHDAVLSFEGGGFPTEQVRLATAGIAAAVLKVRGKGSHAGSAPERGVNALYELSHQILQLRDLSDPTTGLKVNWTVSKAGVVRNMIPPSAEAIADIRVERVADLDGIEQKLRERIKNKLLPDAGRARLHSRPTAAAGQRGEPQARGARGADLCGNRQEARRARALDRRRHRRRVRTVEVESARRRRLRPAGLRRTYHRCRIHFDPLDRAEAVSRGADDHGYCAGKRVV